MQDKITGPFTLGKLDEKFPCIENLLFIFIAIQNPWKPDSKLLTPI